MSTTDHIVQFFAYEHLPPELRKVSAPFCELARVRVDRKGRHAVTVEIRCGWRCVACGSSRDYSVHVSPEVAADRSTIIRDATVDIRDARDRDARSHTSECAVGRVQIIGTHVPSESS